jgi:dTDP-4-amino-4,6-dideoxygalactose transaminase
VINPARFGAVAESLFRDGLCLPSGSNLAAADLERVVTAVGSSNARHGVNRQTCF